MTNFTMPGSEQQSQFAANCKNTCETSWKNEISTINAVDADTSMPNHAKYQVAINALARFAIVHNACRDVMLEPVLPVYGQMTHPNYYNQAPGAQPFIKVVWGNNIHLHNHTNTDIISTKSNRTNNKCT